MAANYFFLILFFFIFFLNTHARVVRQMNNFNKATIDDKPLSAEKDAATFFTTQENSNGHGLYKNSAKDQEVQGFSSATTNEEFNGQDIPAKYSTDVKYNQGGSYANKDALNTRDEDGIYKSYADTKDSTKDENKSDVAGYFADMNQQKGNGNESYDEEMKRFNEMQQYRNEEAKFQEGYEP